MAKWSVHATVVGSKYIGVVEADTKEEAEEKAWKLNNCYVSLCHQCSSHCQDAEVTELYLEPEE